MTTRDRRPTGRRETLGLTNAGDGCEEITAGEQVVHPVGFEPTTFGSVDRKPDASNATNPGTSLLSTPPRAAPGAAAAHANADLAKLVAAWPSLPEAMRRAVLAIVEASAPQTTSTASASKGVDSLDSLYPGYESAAGHPRN